MTLSIKAYFVTLNINDAQQKYAECCYPDCHVSFIVMLNVIMLSGIRLRNMAPLRLGEIKVFRIMYCYERVMVTVLILMTLRFMAKLADLYVKRMLITIQNMHATFERTNLCL